MNKRQPFDIPKTFRVNQKTDELIERLSYQSGKLYAEYVRQAVLEKVERDLRNEAHEQEFRPGHMVDRRRK